jgi:hypothetical protein
MDDDEYADLIRILAPYRDVRIETRPVTLTEEYVGMVDEVESAPENQSGADKTWVETAQREFREYFDRIERQS